MTNILGSIGNSATAQTVYELLPSIDSISTVATEALKVPVALATYAAPFILHSYVLGSVGSLGAAWAGLKIWGYATAKNIANYTIDVTEQAKKGLLRRAHGRQNLIEELVGAVQQGFVILTGQPGCGKTALVEELAVRISKNEIPSLRGAQLIRLNLRNAEGGVGAEAALKNFWFGGVENCIRKLIESVETKYGKGKKIIFLDEIQDLLRGKIDMFDAYKEELARHEIMIIGATTDEPLINQLRNRQGTGAGMARRIQVINIHPMTKADAQLVIEEEAKDQALKYQKERFKFTFEPDVYETIVELSEGRFPGRILPDRAIAFLEDICRSYFNEKFRSSYTMTLGNKEVIRYYARLRSQTEQSVEQKLVQSKRNRVLEQHFQPTFFPQQTALEKAPAFLMQEAQRFDSFFQNNSEAPWMVLKGDSKEVLADVASQWSRADRPVYRCDLKQLVHLANTADGRKALIETLNRDFKDKANAPILILENYRPGWSTTLYPAGAAPVVQDVVQSIGASRIGQTLQNGLAQFGINPSELAKTMEMDAPAPKEDVPLVVTELFNFIKAEKLPTVMLTSGTHAAHLPSEVWKPRTLQSLKLNEVVAWLDTRYQSMQRAAGKEVTANNPWIASIVYAVHHLKDATIPGTVLDLSAKILSLKAKSTQEGLLVPFLEALDGNKSIPEINSALALAGEQIDDHAFDEIHHNDSIVCPEALKSRLHHLISSPRLAVLWVTEDSTVRRQNLMDQMATGLKAVQQTCTHLNYALIKTMPPALKALVLGASLPVLNQATVVTLEEEALQDDAVVKLLQAGNYKVVCFKSQQKQKSSSPAAQAGFVGNLVQQGLDMVKEQVGSLVPAAAATNAAKSIFAQEFEYIPSDLSKGDLRSLLNRHLLDAEVDEAVRPALLNLYMYLAKQPDTTLDQVFDRLDTDMRIYHKTSVEEICKQFHSFYGSEFGMSVDSVKYEVSPQLTSKAYRVQRGIFSAVSTIFSIITYPIRKGAWLFGAVGTALGGFFFSSILGWVRRRIIGF